jgi:RND superfamily putative drug exporter
MTLSSLSFFRSMGPSLAVAVGVTLVAGLTLVPAIVSLLGPRAFWPGATEPTDVYLRSDSGNKLAKADLDAFATRLKAVDGVGSVGAPQLNPPGDTADFSVVLDSAPESDRALTVVDGPLRDATHASAPEGTTALVGGITSVFVDIRAAMNRDYAVVFPVAALLIMLIFQGARGEPGLNFVLPLIMYMFVVALGTDYNILMMSRLREEVREGLSPRPALAMAIRHTGPTIAAAGVILAGSFAVLLLAGNSLLRVTP